MSVLTLLDFELLFSYVYLIFKLFKYTNYFFVILILLQTADMNEMNFLE